MSIFNPALACDYYKIGHPWMQPKGTTRVYSTWTARSYKHHEGCPKTVVFGHQYVIERHIHDFFQKNFFNKPLDDLRKEYDEMIRASFNPTYVSFEKFEALHKLGYLPLEFWSVPEGTLLSVGIPEIVFWNTDENFAWLPQFIEDMWSANAWLPPTSATTAYYRKKLLKPYVDETCENPAILDHMCGDFSLRGHTSLEAGYISGAGHLLSFDRTATIHANTLLKDFYDAKGPAGLGMPSLEHSVVEQGIAYWEEMLSINQIPEYMRKYVDRPDVTWDSKLIAEMCFILYLLTEIQPEGVITYVSDTYDYWGVLTKILPVIRPVILNRKGCFSVRPDSGNPVEIVCGNPRYEYCTTVNGEHVLCEVKNPTPEEQGSMNILFDIFGFTVNSKGYKVLPPQIRLIYGDAITAKISEDICSDLITKKISVENVIFGIGAYTYQYVTRDTRGYAVKATYCEHKDFGSKAIYKAPKTAPWKKSVKGCVAVFEHEPGQFTYVDEFDLGESLNIDGNIMVKKYSNGKFYNRESFEQIKERLNKYALLDELED